MVSEASHEQPRLSPYVLDAVIALAVFLFALPSGLSMSFSTVLNGPAALAFAVPLIWRRTAPDAAALALLPAHLAQLALAPSPVTGNISVPIMMYAVAAYGRERWTRLWLAIGLVASLLAGLRWTYPNWRDPGGLISLTFTVGSCAAMVAASWFAGSLRRSQLARGRIDADRTAGLHREQVQAVRLAATEERQRIAREMHDIVAHSLSIIVVQADGARYVVTEAPGDAEARLARAATAIDTIADTARAALAETRRLVGVLHSEDVPDLAPAAALADIPQLVGTLADTGRAVTLDVIGDPRSHLSLGAVGELAAFRVVQESLTNVLKHAGPDASATVTLHHRPEGLTISVRDDGPGASTPDGQGHGLDGMHERIRALGGTLHTRTAPGWGFEVIAFLPAPLIPFNQGEAP